MMERVLSEESQRIIDDLEALLRLTGDQIIKNYGGDYRAASREILESPVLSEIRNEIMKIQNFSPLRFSITESELKNLKKIWQDLKESKLEFKKFKQED